MKIAKIFAQNKNLRMGGLFLGFALGTCSVLALASSSLYAQAPASNSAPQRGTVKAIDANVLTVQTDGGPVVKITVPEGIKVQQLAPGSMDLKTASASQLSNVSVGDRILAAVRPGNAPDDFTARLVVLMKSSAIAQKNAADQADWKRNGVGGIVRSVGPDGTISIDENHRTVTLATSPETEFRRFASDSAQYQDSQPGSLAQIQPGDQLQVRGTKSADGSAIQATEVVSGSFKNLSGLIASIDPAAGKLTLKDLATKKTYTIEVTKNSNLRRMSPQMAAMVSGKSGRGEARSAEGPPAAHGGGPGGGARNVELSQMISRLPTQSLADLKPGDAVMIVASEPAPGSTSVTALTMLSGVEPILTASPNGGVDLSGWSMGAAPTE